VLAIWKVETRTAGIVGNRDVRKRAQYSYNDGLILACVRIREFVAKLLFYSSTSNLLSFVIISLS
jgi:hypothetical protein